jgi:hypothetical protein
MPAKKCACKKRAPTAGLVGTLGKALMRMVGGQVAKRGGKAALQAAAKKAAKAAAKQAALSAARHGASKLAARRKRRARAGVVGNVPAPPGSNRRRGVAGAPYRRTGAGRAGAIARIDQRIA